MYKKQNSMDIEEIKQYLIKKDISEMIVKKPDEIVEERYQKFRNMGEFIELTEGGEK